MIPVSLLSAYLYCPRKLYLQKVLKISEPTRESNLKGTIKHMALQGFSNRESELVSSIYPEHIFEDIKKLFENTLSSQIKNAIIENKKAINRLNIEPSDVYNSTFRDLKPHIETRAENVWNFISVKNLYGADLWENLTPKIKSEYSLQSETYKLTGVIDQVFVYPEKIVPVELKTGKPPEEGIWPGHKIQLAAYMLMLEDIFNFSVETGFINYISEKEQRQLQLNPFLKQDVIKTRELVEKLLLSNNIPDHLKKESKCTRCPLKKSCHDESYVQGLLDGQQKTLNTT